MSSRILLALTSLMSICWLMPAEAVDYQCSREAKNLRYAADEYESAVSNLESAKDSYESTCNPDYGYSANDASACSRYGYERTEYESALEGFRSAFEDLTTAYEAVTRRCEPPDYKRNSPVSACFLMLSESKKELAQCEAAREPPTNE